MKDIRDLIRDLTVYGPEVESLRGDDGFAFDESLPVETITDHEPICPACECGDHEASWLCEHDYQCTCACHFARTVRELSLEECREAYERVKNS